MTIKEKKKFWKNKKVFITGHTGFKGAWISLFLNELGAKVTGYALKPKKKNNLYIISNLKKYINKSYYGNILDKKKLTKIILKEKPDIIIHMAAQSLVGESYKNPINTFNTNCLGTVNLMEISRKIKNLKLVLITTSDKVYDVNNKKVFKETHNLKGQDPYSASKVCQENIVYSYFMSFFFKKKSILTVRSGNILGGGDFSDDRIVPDYFRAYLKNKRLKIRNKHSSRPWQHILDASDAYINLIEKFFNKYNSKNEISWNVCSKNKKSISVLKLLEKLNNLSNKPVKFSSTKKKYLETKELNLNSNKMKQFINWSNKIDIDQSIKLTFDWYSQFIKNRNNSYKITISQIKNYLLLR